MEIKKTVDELIKTYHTTSPEELSERLNICLMDAELPESTRGFCLMISSGTAIVLNSTLTKRERTSVVAHELGHAILHKGCNYVFMTTKTCMVAGRFEREADLFAAYLLTASNPPQEGSTLQGMSAALSLPESAIEAAISI